MASRTPGDLGIYGFRNRADHSYDGLFIANGAADPGAAPVGHRRARGKRSIVLGVPGTYPLRPLNGVMVCCFLTPFDASQYTFPPALRRRGRGCRRRVPLRLHGVPHRGQGRPAAPDLRDDRPALRARRPPPRDEAVGALRDGRDGHRPHPPRLLEGHGPPTASTCRAAPTRTRILDYHRHVDGLLGSCCATPTTRRPCSWSPTTAPKRMDGGIRVNEWLRREGLLAHAARARPGGRCRARCGIDWSRTKVWAEGGYYSRVFLNVEGREPEGTIPAADYERCPRRSRRGHSPLSLTSTETRSTRRSSGRRTSTER